ncbi:phenylalanine ammonia-lyase [Colletotrichum tofieldiae]|nr:phenylalanine ammonia-lyase [Colletotrichum tofieldiae]GKT81542.1 phenylalanine ammonia-lyase [Colletotrichum tofieldiae]
MGGGRKVGKLLFAQTTEIFNPNLNNGLPANLAADDPTTSFTIKGIDINMAAYMSELAYLANPVSSHLQAAEMHNQSINSLAFVSARMTHQAVELVSMMASSHLFIACQALDLRAIQLDFFSEISSILVDINKHHLDSYVPKVQLVDWNLVLVSRIQEAWKGAFRLDVIERFDKIFEQALPVLLQALERSLPGTAPKNILGVIQVWGQALRQRLAAKYQEIFNQFQKAPNTTEYLGVGGRALYSVIRNGLKLPFHLGVTDPPVGFDDHGESKRTRRTVGSWVSIIYEALLEGKIVDVLHNAKQHTSLAEERYGTRSKGNGNQNGTKETHNGTYGSH